MSLLIKKSSSRTTVATHGLLTPTSCTRVTRTYSASSRSFIWGLSHPRAARRLEFLSRCRHTNSRLTRTASSLSMRCATATRRSYSACLSSYVFSCSVTRLTNHRLLSSTKYPSSRRNDAKRGATVPTATTLAGTS